jgi:hypothetical protein
MMMEKRGESPLEALLKCVAEIKKAEEEFIKKHGRPLEYYLDPDCGITPEQLEEIASGKFAEQLPELLEKKDG